MSPSSRGEENEEDLDLDESHNISDVNNSRQVLLSGTKDECELPPIRGASPNPNMEQHKDDSNMVTLLPKADDMNATMHVDREKTEPNHGLKMPF